MQWDLVGYLTTLIQLHIMSNKIGKWFWILWENLKELAWSFWRFEWFWVFELFSQRTVYLTSDE
jgi:hypothetical protein